MKLTLKNLEQQTFTVEIEASKTVKELKQAVQSQMGEGYPADNQRLIYLGKILDDNHVLSECNIKDSGLIIVMIVKSKAPSGETAEVTTDTPSQHEVSEILIQNIVSMGYDRAQVEAALNVSLNDPNRAVEILLSGSNPLAEGAPMIEDLRAIIEQIPELTNDPNFMEVYSRNPEALLSLLSESLSSSDPLRHVPGGVTSEERAAIERLKALGYPEHIVVQAYIVCNKDENAAANLLLSESLDDSQ